jgi:multicomponent Na+:H+ antiporter subunit D
MGVAGAFLTGDIFNLYVWFEVLLISSFVLLALGSERAQLEGAIKYVMLNLVSSFLFLIATGILYGAVGTLNMADAARKLQTLDNPDLVSTLAMLFLIAFGIKAAVFPLFFWLPASYHTPPAAVSAVFAGLLTKVGVYALIRVFTLLFTQNPDVTHRLILVLAGLTMVTGVLGAVAQNEFRRILSFHIISQIGYMILGLGLYTKLALAGSVFYIAHHIIVKTNLFLVSGVVHTLQGTYDLNRLGGAYRRWPWLAALFAVPALSLAGLPPLSGFVAKLILVQAGLAVGEYVIVGVALAVSLLTLYSMSKIWNAVFWQTQPELAPGPPRLVAGEHPPGPLTRGELVLLVAPIVGLAVLTVLIGLLAGPVFAWAAAAAAELLDPAAYIRAVLGESA